MEDVSEAQIKKDKNKEENLQDQKIMNESSTKYQSRN